MATKLTAEITALLTFHKSTGIHTNFNGNTKYICASVGYNYNERGILGKCASRNGEWVFVHRLRMCRFERYDWIDSLHERLP